jgi:hypothetical protein
MSSAVARIAHLIALVVISNSDVKTIARWANHVGVSAGALRGYCRVIGVRPKAALDFARLLRLVVRARTDWTPWLWLDVSDEHNMRRLLHRGGLQERGDAPPLDQFLSGQQLLSDRPQLIDAVRQVTLSRVPWGRAHAAALGTTSQIVDRNIGGSAHDDMEDTR